VSSRLTKRSTRAAGWAIFDAKLIGGGRVTANVRQRNHDRPTRRHQRRLLLHPIAAAQFMLVSNIQPNNSPKQHLNPRLTYVVSFNDGLKHHSRATTNAKHPTPEKLRTFDAIFFGAAYRQTIAASSPKGCGLVMVTSTIVPTINEKKLATVRNSMPVQR
jgi:hypothetical protein